MLKTLDQEGSLEETSPSSVKSSSFTSLWKRNCLMKLQMVQVRTGDVTWIWLINLWKISTMLFTTITNWHWMNLVRYFRKSPDLCYRKQFQNSLDIRNCLHDASTKQMTKPHTFNRVQTFKEIFERYKLEDDDFLKPVVTEDETWVARSKPQTNSLTCPPPANELKPQYLLSMPWHYKGSHRPQHRGRPWTLNKN